MRFRRKRSRGCWLPVEPTFFGAESQAAVFHQEQYDSPSNNGDITPPISVPVAFDRTVENNVASLTTTTTMRDITEGQDYFLDRIVGKVWGDLFQSEATGPLQILLCMAFAILPVSDDQPGAPALSNDSRNPLLAQNTMEPWIWRRTWRLTNQAVLNAFGPDTVVMNGHTSVENFGSVMDAGHVDARTRRRIRHNERLFFVSSAACLFQGSGGTSDGITVGFDVRLHGGLRRHKNRSSFQ